MALWAAVMVSSAMAEELWPPGLLRVRQPAPEGMVLVDHGRAVAGLVLLDDSELVRNAADWLVGFLTRSTGAELPISDARSIKAGGRHLIAATGDSDPLLKRLVAAGTFRLEPRVGRQGYVVQRVNDTELGEVLVCWSPAPIGCRYGLIEILRSLQVAEKTVRTGLGRVVERPQFSLRICYVNFAEHLQNAFNPNLLFDTAVNRWTPADWERFIDMLSAYRYNVFEFWLVPTLFAPEAIRGGKVQTQFAETMNRVIAYGKRRGVAVHPILTVNTVGQDWHYHCPKEAKEHDELITLWDYWSRTLKGNDSIGFFPGDPGGCYRNGCTKETFVDLCLELTPVVRKNNPDLTIEIGTWGDPMGGWEVPLWTAKPDLAQRAMKYLLAKLPEFPPGTFTSINLGFSPDCLATSHGGDGRPYARAAAKTHRVLTWDYSVTEGEGTVSPRCRVRRIFERRREELALGCYSGGICYTMAPKLNCQSIFCCAEAWWNPGLEPDAVLADYGRLTFGDPLAAIGPLLEEFEVIPDWGYYPPFPYSPQRLAQSMARILPLLTQIDPGAPPRLPIAPAMAEYRSALIFYADLFQKLAAIALGVDELNTLAKATGKVPPDRKEAISLAEAEQFLADRAEFPNKTQLRVASMRLRQLNTRALTQSYWDTVYGIYSVIPHPVDPRAQGATATLFKRFNTDLVMAHESSLLEKAK